jgi:hypothetical protein
MHRQAVIGLIGGLSWESSTQYYRIINREVRDRLGGVHSARDGRERHCDIMDHGGLRHERCRAVKTGTKSSPSGHNSSGRVSRGIGNVERCRWLTEPDRHAQRTPWR